MLHGYKVAILRTFEPDKNNVCVTFWTDTINMHVDLNYTQAENRYRA